MTDQTDIHKTIAEIKEGLVGVTPGPWSFYSEPEEGMFGDVCVFDVATGNFYSLTENPKNAAHIARCDPDTMRAVIEHVEGTEAYLATACTELSEFSEQLSAKDAEIEARRLREEHIRSIVKGCLDSAIPEDNDPVLALVKIEKALDPFDDALNADNRGGEGDG